MRIGRGLLLHSPCWSLDEDWEGGGRGLLLDGEGRGLLLHSPCCHRACGV